MEGYRQYCAEARGFAFGELDQGAFGDFAIWNEAFVYRIPEAIESRHAGPLMCAGVNCPLFSFRASRGLLIFSQASVFEALDAAGTSPASTVGVVGIGGLGHMAILFAKAMGCAVTAFSAAPSKREDAMKLGADEFRVLGDEDMAPGSANPVDVLLVCANETPSFELLLPHLARRAIVVLMSIQLAPLSIPYMPFILPGHRLIASTEASRKNHIDMLAFVARHNIKPWIQEFAMTEEGVAEAFDVLEAGEMRFRGVLCAQ